VTSSAAPRFRLFALGRPNVLDSEGNRIESVVQQPKRLALLAYLASASSGEAVRRDTLLPLFWPELDEDHARNALNQSVFGLRRSLGRRTVVSRGNEELWLDHDRLWCDTAGFEGSIAAGRDAEALDFFRGDFLEGLVLTGVAPDLEHWMDAQRAGFRDAAVAAAWRLAAAEEQRDNAVGAVRWAWRASDLHQADEATQSRLIDLLDRQGDAAGALNAYGAFRKRLWFS
jgi:DNA-binding SARP family transcriptional activator